MSPNAKPKGNPDSGLTFSGRKLNNRPANVTSGTPLRAMADSREN